MLWKEIAIGFLLAGFIGLLGDDFFNVLFITDAPPLLRTLENVIVGPLIAVLSFVCSVGNVPLAAVLWSGGIGFGGVVAFLFADLIVIPIVLAYRKYYGNAFALRIIALMLVTIILAALIVDGVFGLVGLVPTGPRPTRTDVFGSVGLNYKLVLNVIATAIFLALVWLSRSGSGAGAGILFLMNKVNKSVNPTRQGYRVRSVPAPEASEQSQGGASSVSFQGATKRYGELRRPGRRPPRPRGGGG